MASMRMNRRTAVGCAVAGVALCETLESRRMLAIHPAPWTLRGTPLDDTITIRVNPAKAGQFQALINNKVISVRNVKAVSAIKINGGGGDDQISLDLGTDYTNLPSTINGGGGDDDIEGHAGADYIVGGPGADSLAGGMGDDIENGGAGNDLLEGDEGADSLDGDLGNDTLAGGLGDDSMDGGTGDDQLSGGYGDDEVAGDSGTDVLAGGDGADSLNGGSGIDTIYHETKDYWKYNRLDLSRDDLRTNPLEQVQDADTLKQTLIDAAVQRWQGQLGKTAYPYWWYWYRGGGYYVADSSGAVLNSQVGSGGVPASADPGSHSGTNNQVSGVDEQDIVKNDGNYIYLVRDGKLLILDAWPADQAHIVSTTDLDGWVSGLYLDGNRVTVVSQRWQSLQQPVSIDSTAGAAMRIMPYWGWGSKAQTIVTVYDVSDRANPIAVSKTTLDGSLTDSRDIDGHIYLVLDNSIALPSPLLIPVDLNDGAAPGDGSGDGILSTDLSIRPPQDGPTYVYESEADYRARLEAMDLSQLLPGWKSEANGVTTTGGLADLSKLYLPTSDRDYSSMFSIVTLNAADETPAPLDSTSVVGFSGQVYVSSQSIYVTAGRYDWKMGEWGGDYQTDIYKFALHPDSVTFEGTGEVAGWVKDQYAMDEQGDTFRIATTTQEDGQSNNVFVLKDMGDTLDAIGGITGLAFGEQIYATRFMGDRAYIVTFHRTDPLFSIDLSDPANPSVAGVLEMPGYSSYLYPIDATHLIGLGRDADADGRVNGLKVSLFDVSDIHNPVLVDTFRFESTAADQGHSGWWTNWNSSPAEWDPHAFSYFPDQHVLAVPVLDWGWWHGDARLEVLKVDPTQGFTEIGQVGHDSAVQRSMQIGDYLYSLSENDLKIVSIEDPADEVADVILPAVTNTYYGGTVIFSAPRTIN